MSTYRNSIEVRTVGSQYWATIRVNSLGGQGRDVEWSGSGATEQAAIWNAEARVRARANWRGSRYRGVGRKPRGYREARQAVRFLESLRTVPSALTPAA